MFSNKKKSKTTTPKPYILSYEELATNAWNNFADDFMKAHPEEGDAAVNETEKNSINNNFKDEISNTIKKVAENLNENKVSPSDYNNNIANILDDLFNKKIFYIDPKLYLYIFSLKIVAGGNQEDIAKIDNKINSFAECIKNIDFNPPDFIEKLNNDRGYMPDQTILDKITKCISNIVKPS
jgi:hypothetical protein